MQYLEAIIAGFFKIDADGRTLFFPWQQLGAGYLVPSDARAAQLRLWIRYGVIAAIVLVLFGMIVFGPAALVGVPATLVLAYYGWTQVGIADLQLTEQSRVAQENAGAKTIVGGVSDENLLRIGGLGCAAFALIGLVMLLTNPGERWGTALLLIIIFGGGAAGCFYRLKQRGG